MAWSEGSRAASIQDQCKPLAGGLCSGDRRAETVLRQFSIPVAAGLAVGVGGAAALSNVLRFLLYGIGNLDLLAYLGAIAVFAVTVAVAALIPARRALRVDLMRALRYE